MATSWRTLVVPAALAIALAAGCGSDNSSSSTTTPAPSAPAGTSAPGQVATSMPASSDPAVTGDDAATVGARVEKVKLGDHVVLRLVSDTDETYHVHGYDLEQKVAAGVEAQFEFTADKAGDFEVESHNTDKVYVVLHVGK